MNVTVVRSPPQRYEAEERDLADIGANPAPELVAAARKNVHEVRVEPLRHQKPQG
jgi:hypothetical protein